MNSPSPAALAGIPADIRCASDYERAAQRHLAAPDFAYVHGGSGGGRTAQRNLDAFAQWSITPRVLRDVRLGHTRLRLGGQVLAHPILLAPVALQTLVHPNGELDSARAAFATETCMVCSTLSGHRLEEVALAGGLPRWFQLYLQPQREHSLDLLRRAEAAGYGAIMLTVDAGLQPANSKALEAGFQLPAHCIAANLSGYGAPPETQAETGSRVFQSFMRQTVRWEDLDWLLAQTRLPVWVKGVLHPEDSLALKRRGVAGVVVSNHGGRTLDGAPAALEQLPSIRAAVGPEFPLLLDGGIRSGSDAFIAVARGADAVMIGRLQMYALAVAGALGVAHLLKLLREELEICMALTGCASLADIRGAGLQRTNVYSGADARC